VREHPPSSSRELTSGMLGAGSSAPGRGSSRRAGGAGLGTLLFQEGFCPWIWKSLVSEARGTTHGTGVTQNAQLPSPSTAARASSHLMSYANPELPESWDFLTFSFTHILKFLALRKANKRNPNHNVLQVFKPVSRAGGEAVTY